MNQNRDFYSISTFSDFQKLATDESLSKYGKIGFPDSYREGFEQNIFFDILNKLTNLRLKNQIVLDIGPGCSDVPLQIIDHCKQINSKIYLIDSTEMLAMLPDESCAVKIPGSFPDCVDLISELRGKINVIICYSVFQYIFKEKSFFDFLNLSINLLAPGGQMLIGDIPNVSMKNRFLSSEKGKVFHKEFMRTEKDPEINFINFPEDKIDDSIIFAILQRTRSRGCHSYVIPQSDNLPISNRREDILIIKP